MTVTIAEKIYEHLDQQVLLQEESRGTSDLLYIDTTFIREVKSRKKNLAMAWIDYNKYYVMALHL